MSIEHQKIIQRIHLATGIEEKLIRITMKNYFKSVRSLLVSNEEVIIPYIGKLLLRKRYKKVIEKKGKNINLRSRTRKNSLFK